MRRFILLILLITTPPLWAVGVIPDTQILLLKNESPLVAFRIAFLTGSANDPAGKEGVAALTASLLSDGGSQKNSYQEILQLLFPMAAGYSSQVDKEMTVFVGVVHKDHLNGYYELLRNAILTPGFKEDDFDRLKTDQLNYVAKTLRFNNDEELGKETLNWAIFKGHPYGRPNEGTTSAIQSLTLQDVKNFYQDQYTTKNLIIGVAGNYPPNLIQKLKQDFAKLPEGIADKESLPPAPKIEGVRVVIVEKKTPATAFSFGYPLSFTRSQEDYFPMMVMNSWLGQHRTLVGRLFNVMREQRGLNYGDYSYIEHFAFGGSFHQPPPNFSRHQQIFQVWIRPVPHAVRHFALRQAVREVQMLSEKGLTEGDLQGIRNYLLNYMVSLAQSNSELLGYALDDHFYKLPKSYFDLSKQNLESLDLNQVNAAIKKHLSTKNMVIAVVTENAEGFKKALIENAPSPIKYDSPKPEAILEEDKLIMNFPFKIQAENITIIPADKMFE
ncbi:insulinase family protein [bacterium]|nr:insulinase family protein [bacterium]